MLLERDQLDSVNYILTNDRSKIAKKNGGNPSRPISHYQALGPTKLHGSRQKKLIWSISHYQPEDSVGKRNWLKRKTSTRVIRPSRSEKGKQLVPNPLILIMTKAIIINKSSDTIQRSASNCSLMTKSSVTITQPNPLDTRSLSPI